MAGFANDANLNEIVQCNNVDFTGNVNAVGQITTDGQLLIGSSVAPSIRTGTLGSSDGSITWTVGHGTITGQVAGGTSVLKTITGNTGGAESPSAGNFNFLTANTTVKFAGTSATETLDFGLTNLIFGSSIPSATGSAIQNVGLGSGVLTDVLNGQANTCIGFNCGSSLTNGGDNSCVGNGSLDNATTSNSNSCLGVSTLGVLLTGSHNIAIGQSSGIEYTSSESSNILINHLGITGESNVIRIGTQGSGGNQQSDCYLAGILHTTSGRTRNITVPGAYPYTLLSTDDIISASSSAAHTINLPNAPTTGTIYIIKDVTGTAQTNNISITTPGGTVTIDGQTTYTMSINYQSITVYFSGTAYFII